LTRCAAAPIETEPLFVRAGSIIPCGPRIEYAMSKSVLFDNGGIISEHRRRRNWN
jgi:alpha-glucosidase (family GH31 glycosyl hydrolase)